MPYRDDGKRVGGLDQMHSNGPHPPKLHVDEVGLMREETLHEAEKMEEVRSSDRGVALDPDDVS